MIVQVSSVAVPQSLVSVQIEDLRSRTIPTYQAAEGFVSLCLLQRPFVAYVELLMISIWESEPAWNRFTASQVPVDGAETDHDVIRLGLRTYELLVSGESTAQNTQNLFGFVQSSR
jgi:heme-degrading monooxygenase HmoA